MNRTAAAERGGVVLNVMLFLVLVGLIATHWLILPDPSRRNLEFLPDMVESVPRAAQDPVVAVAGGMAPDLRPPAGAVARDHLPLGYDATPEEALRAGRELRNPFSAEDAAALERGTFVFTQFCAVCHGPSGMGDGPATKRGVPPPPSLLLEHALEMPDGQMFHLISLGGGNMAAYASQVPRDDRWKAILHVRAMQQQAEHAGEEADVAASAGNEGDVTASTGQPAGTQEGGG